MSTRPRWWSRASATTPAASAGRSKALLAEAQRRSPQRATPELSRAVGGPLTIKLAAFPLDGQPADVTLAIYDRRHSTPVASGENQGRMLDNFNIVRHLEVLARWDGSAASWTMRCRPHPARPGRRRDRAARRPRPGDRLQQAGADGLGLGFSRVPAALLRPRPRAKVGSMSLSSAAGRLTAVLGPDQHRQDVPRHRTHARPRVGHDRLSAAPAGARELRPHRAGEGRRRRSR